jgi:hypothetical protein
VIHIPCAEEHTRVAAARSEMFNACCSISFSLAPNRKKAGASSRICLCSDACALNKKKREREKDAIAESIYVTITNQQPITYSVITFMRGYSIKQSHIFHASSANCAHLSLCLPHQTRCAVMVRAIVFLSFSLWLLDRGMRF